MLRSHRLALLLWTSSFQYFIVQLIVAAAWREPYSWLHNAISDLGNTACAPYGERFVCSPLHGLMNGSFILLGLTQLLGAVLVFRTVTRPSLRVGLVTQMVAGVGTILVGLFPENTIGSLHLIGAIMPFVLGNAGLLLLGGLLRNNKAFRLYSSASAIIALSACLLLYFGQYLGLGFGGMERLTAYPQTIWLVVVGICLLRTHQQSRS